MAQQSGQRDGKDLSSHTCTSTLSYQIETFLQPPSPLDTPTHTPDDRALSSTTLAPVLPQRLLALPCLSNSHGDVRLATVRALCVCMCSKRSTQSILPRLSVLLLSLPAWALKHLILVLNIGMLKKNLTKTHEPEVNTARCAITISLLANQSPLPHGQSKQFQINPVHHCTSQ